MRPDWGWGPLEPYQDLHVAKSILPQKTGGQLWGEDSAGAAQCWAHRRQGGWGLEQVSGSGTWEMDVVMGSVGGTGAGDELCFERTE